MGPMRLCTPRLRATVVPLTALLGIAFAPARADVVVTWMEVAEHAATKAFQEGDEEQTAATTRSHAQVALSIFLAANGIERRYEPYLELPAAPAGASVEAAVATAAYERLTAIFPGQKQLFDDALFVTLAGLPNGPGKEAGAAFGKTAAAAAGKRAALPDGTAVRHYRPLTALGVYIDPRLPSILPFETVMPPFFLARADELRPAGPPPVGSDRYARDLEEVRRLGAKVSAERPKVKELLARPWLWINYQRMMAEIARRPGRSIAENARLFALANMALEDAWLAIMEAKMKFETWRPITAIRNADRDGTDLTVHDPAWEPLLKTPTHSDYPCGHCGVAAAVAAVLESETGPAPQGGIRLASWDENPGFTIVLPTWKAFVDEMSMSRIYAGAHTRSANEDAEAIGRAAAKIALAQLRPVP